MIVYEDHIRLGKKLRSLRYGQAHVTAMVHPGDFNFVSKSPSVMDLDLYV